MKLYKILFPVFFLSIFQMACPPHKVVLVTNLKCFQTGVVKDFQDMDGCGLLIVIAPDVKLLPVNMDKLGFSLKSGQNIRFDYKEVEGITSACMIEKAAIEITCISLIENPQVFKEKCFDITKKAINVEWIKKAITVHQPQQVIKYKYRTDGWAYLFTGENIFLYDCQGTLICSKKSKEECLKFVEYESLNNGVIVWDGLGAND